MKTTKLFLLFSVLVSPLFAQFTDDFSDGDFTNNPSWTGDVGEFLVTARELQSNGPEASDVLYLSTPSTAINEATWEFLVRMDFAPSTSNQVKVYLVSDQANLEGDLNGYFIEIGQSSDDAIKLRRQSGASGTTIFTGSSTFSGNVLVRIRVTRDATGNWKVYSDTSGGTTFTSEGVGVLDDTHTTSSYFGVVCKHSSTRKDLFFFDDFNVSVAPDTTPPTLTSLSVISNTSLDLLFSEAVNQSVAETAANYSVNNGIEIAIQAIQDNSNPALIHLTFTNNFINFNTYMLTVSTIEDLFGNTATNLQESFDYFVPDTAEPYDIVINEIMADPTPEVGLPNAEWVELYNRTTDKHIDLNGFKLNDKLITDTKYILSPNSYVILTSQSNAPAFTTYGDVMGMSSFDALTNGGETVTLTNAIDLLIYKVSYDLSWYNSANKDDGGHTLELIDPDNTCGEDRNWTASTDDDGGTPGKQNSVFASNPDLIAPTIIQVVGVNADSILVQFDESIDEATIIASNIELSNSLQIQEMSVDENNQLWIRVSPPMESSETYQLSISGVADKCGNALAQFETTFSILMEAQQRDILINELLFDPKSPNADFVELYNHSSGYINLQGWAFANVDGTGGIDNIKTIATGYLIIVPQQYLVLTEEKQALESDYPNAVFENIIQVNDLPSYPNDRQTVMLLNPDGEMYDSLDYDDNMHNSLLDITDGVSLERISFEAPTNNPDNWHSAAKSVGFATPGYANSQSIDQQTNLSEQVVVSPEVFLPNQSGSDDFTTINYTFDQSGYIATVSIIDMRGRVIRYLAENELLGTVGFFQWNGTMSNGDKARSGVYVVLFEVFDLNGTKKIVKKRVVVAPEL